MNSLYTKPFYKLFTSWNVLYVRVSIIRVGIELFFLIKKKILSTHCLDRVSILSLFILSTLQTSDIEKVEM